MDVPFAFVCVWPWVACVVVGVWFCVRVCFQLTYGKHNVFAKESDKTYKAVLYRTCFSDILTINEAFCKAVQNGHIETVSLFLSSTQLNPAMNHNLAIRYSCAKGHTH